MQLYRKLRKFNAGGTLATFAYYIGLLAIPIGCGWKSVAIGQDLNYDMMNYHFYDAWAFLKGRIFSDVFVAGSASLVNPLPTVPTYYLETHINPELAGFIIGAFQGLAPMLVALIVSKMMGSRVLGLIAGATAAISGGFVSELGNDMGDSLVAPFLLLSAWIAVVAVQKNYAVAHAGADGGGHSELAGAGPKPLGALGMLWCWFASGLAAGLGSGLKLTQLPIAAGLVGASFLVMRGGTIGRIRSLGASALGLIAGLAATNGYWTYELIKRYGDPFVFLGASGFGFHDKYVAVPSPPPSGGGFSLVAEFRFLWSPITAFYNPTKFAEIPIKEASLAIAVALFGLAVVFFVIRFAANTFRKISEAHGLAFIKVFRDRNSLSPDALILKSTDRYVIVAFLISLFFWFRIFQIYRYLIPLEVFGAVVVIALLRRIFEAARPGFVSTKLGRRLILGVFSVLALFSMLTADPFNYWIRAPFSSKFAVVQTPAMMLNGKLNLLVETGNGGLPADFLLPYFKGRFIAIGGNNILPALSPPTRVLLNKAFDAVAANHGSVIAYWRNTPNPPPPTALVSELSPYPLRLRSCVNEEFMVGADWQSLQFCEYVKATNTRG